MIKFLVLDVDGTLTDGKLYIADNGELFKAFDVKDGCGIKDILPSIGIIPIIITARESKILEHRSNELNIKELHQGIRNKLDKLYEILDLYSLQDGKNYTLQNVAYMGDDLLDVPCMDAVKEANGIVGCPKDAVGEVLKIANFISDKNGGCGAVREFIEYLKMIQSNK